MRRRDFDFTHIQDSRYCDADITDLVSQSFFFHIHSPTTTVDKRSDQVTRKLDIFKLAFFFVSVGAKVIKSLGSSRAQFLLKPYRDEWKN